MVATAGLALLGRFFFMYPYRTLTLHRENFVPMFGFIGLSLIIGHLAAARKRAEDHERAERRRFQATVTSIGEAVIATDARGKVTFLNRVAEGLTGWDLPEAAGKRLEEVFVVVNGLTRGPITSPVKAVLETGRTQGLANHTILIARDGCGTAHR